MAEQANNTALATIDGEYQIDVKEFDASGRSSIFKVPIPNNIDAQTASVMLRAAILKATTWKVYAFPIVLHAVIYADRMGLDIMAGDCYMAQEGRLSTTAGAKIRHAMSTGKIKGYTVDITDGPEISLKNRQGQEAYKGPNLQAKVTVTVDGWNAPVVYQTTLSEWFMGSNPNWTSRPAYMLRRNALSKALEEVAPMGVEAEEAPPIEQPIMPTRTSVESIT